MSHDGTAAEFTNIYLAGPARVLVQVIFVALLALVIRALVHHLISRLTSRAAQTFLPRVPHKLLRNRIRRRPAAGPPAPSASSDAEALSGLEAGSGPEAETAADAPSVVDIEHALVDERRHQRVHALGAILRSASSITIFAIAGFVILGDLGINLAPLLASAGVVGVAIGFGAQNLVRDYLSGIFMLLEDQYGVGDSIKLGDASGTVETVTLRITRLRDINGTVWHVRNGAIERVGNESQGWARAVIDYPVPYEADLGTIRTLVTSAAEALWTEPEWRAVMLSAPEVWGAQEVTKDVVTMRVVVKTSPLRQWAVQREMRARIHATLDAAGIEFPPSSCESGDSGP
jgi:small-conductance mechanosensitive channel